MGLNELYKRIVGGTFRPSAEASTVSQVECEDAQSSTRQERSDVRREFKRRFCRRNCDLIAGTSNQRCREEEASRSEDEPVIGTLRSLFKIRYRP